MNTRNRCFLLAALITACFAATLPAQAAGDRAYATVDSVQMPAWVERNGMREALAPGKVLQNRDRVLTGADARVLIALAEGSAVKLGENAQLDLNALGRSETHVFTAALDVARGAFRFTTGIFSSAREARAVNVRIATITAGIRGTDLWGSADGERDLVCLLDGRIAVFHALVEAREMSEALSFYVAPKGAAPEPLGTVGREQVAKWAAQTEIQPGSGYAQRGGKWHVELATLDTEIDALALYDRARTAGYAVSVLPRAAAGGVYRYAVRIRQLPSKAEAEILSSQLSGALAPLAPRVMRY
jgi:hypothetical protein